MLSVKRVGICGTDKAFYKGTYKPLKLPLIPGHEVVGVVVNVGEGVDRDLIGLKVTSEINFYCGRCYYCRIGLKTHCPYREVLGISRDGGMAEYMITRQDLIHSVENLTEIQATFIEPLAAVIEMLELAPINSNYNVAVIGDGAIGLLSMRTILATSKPNRLVAIVRADSPKIPYVKYSGVDEIVADYEVNEYVKKNTPEGQGFDYVVEATGSPRGLLLATDIVRPRGIISVKSTHGELVPLDITKLVVKEVKVVGSRCGPFEKAINLLKRKLVKVEDLVTSEYPLSRGIDAFKKSYERDQIRVHIKI